MLSTHTHTYIGTPIDVFNTQHMQSTHDIFTQYNYKYQTRIVQSPVLLNKDNIYRGKYSLKKQFN
jgi:hypothetical protein